MFLIDFKIKIIIVLGHSFQKCIFYKNKCTSNDSFNNCIFNKLQTLQNGFEHCPIGFQNCNAFIFQQQV